jgi:Zn finger protein HypA/HybF involved in hydrogenase expression
MQIIPYAGGMSMVERQDKPELQCTQCNKPWWYDDFSSIFIKCPHCEGELRRITLDEPFNHR